MATEDARYRLSSQYRLWSFSPAKLRDLREKTNALVRPHITARLAELKPTEPAPEFLTAEEETVLLRFFTTELIRAAIHCDLPTEIRATAAVFLKRFYVTNSLMTYPPMDLIKTCLFFGGKAEGYFAKLSKLAEKLSDTTEEKILAGEFLLCQGIRFAFDVRHPFRGLEGAILELRRQEDIDKPRIDAAHQQAREILKVSPLLTDAYFHYAPSQIMLAALSLADRGLAERIINSAFAPTRREEAGRNADATATEMMHPTSSEIKEKVTAAIEACRDMLATEPPERMETYWGKAESLKLIRPLLKKLRRCRDPDKADLVELQRARREWAANASKEKEAGQDRKKTNAGLALGEPIGPNEPKRRKVTGPSAADDVFGGALGQ
ncbi:cyclin ccl1 [Sodiomyces alkalinus F11]|uniref:Cyclin ccl1 n=1 Tax=Sodiomyces alkalinus (strain CBS 110278 / VKM F-3762 / F11) TaxID=1314773 RepID=A0A3N2PIW6_SODAK|nr:cyclin ccl1 [Sodiomyces alkalinus F11]ROT34493.1 cyclin ccl1 [Sodiomyces alkalinus F11]